VERILKAGRLILLSVWLSPAVICQTNAGPPQSIKLEDAVALAADKLPVDSDHSSTGNGGFCRYRSGADSLCSRLDLLWQENRASVNNIFGTTLPQAIIPSITGPVLGTKSFTSTFGTSTGALFSWEPFDFGYRKANVEENAHDAGRTGRD
jgi:hypothetical protein